MAFALFTEGYRKTAVGELYHSFAFDRFRDLAGRLAELAVPVSPRV